MHPLITNNLDAIRALASEFGVSRLEAFGSVCTDTFDPATSDIDFLVEYPDGYDFGPWDARLNQLRRALTSLLGQDVDLVEARALRNPWFRQEAARTRRLIYDAATVTKSA